MRWALAPVLALRLCEAPVLRFCEGLGAGTQGLAVGELDEVSVRVSQAAVVAHGIGIFAGRPGETPGLAPAFGQIVDRLTALHSESEMAVVGAVRVSPGTTGDEHEYEVGLSARFGEPRHHVVAVSAAVDAAQIAELLVEREACFDVADVQGDMRQCGFHAGSIARRSRPVGKGERIVRIKTVQAALRRLPATMGSFVHPSHPASLQG